MLARNLIQKLIDEKKVKKVLTRGPEKKEEVRYLQHILCELGFGKELNWEEYGADGIYGPATVEAVRTFAYCNALSCDGSTVDMDMAKKMISRYDILGHMRILYQIVKQGNTGERLCRGSSDYKGLVALQTLLKELGFSEALNWKSSESHGRFGNSTDEALRIFAELEEIPYEPGKVSTQFAARIISKIQVFFGTYWFKEVPFEELSILEKVENGKDRYYVSDGKARVCFTKFEQGFYYHGSITVSDACEKNKKTILDLGLNASGINVILAMAGNESKLDEVKNGGGSFLTFGMFGWDMGTGAKPGELASLLSRFKNTDSETYRECFGQYGLDIELTDQSRGFLVLKDRKLAQPREKDVMRSVEWAFRFRESALTPIMQGIQVRHAFSRINTFYRIDRYKAGSYYIADLITSEYGMALLLDQHVNCPDYLRVFLDRALAEVNLPGPAAWGTKEENLLLEAFLKVRAAYGAAVKAESQRRVSVINKYLDAGIISNERGSFRFP